MHYRGEYIQLKTMSQLATTTLRSYYMNTQTPHTDTTHRHTPHTQVLRISGHYSPLIRCQRSTCYTPRLPLLRLLYRCSLLGCSDQLRHPGAVYSRVGIFVHRWLHLDGRRQGWYWDMASIQCLSTDICRHHVHGNICAWHHVHAGQVSTWSPLT